MTAIKLVFLFGVGTTVLAGFGYLAARAAPRKGYPLWPFWILATFLLVPTMILITLLPDRTASRRG